MGLWSCGGAPAPPAPVAVEVSREIEATDEPAPPPPRRNVACRLSSERWVGSPPYFAAPPIFFEGVAGRVGDPGYGLPTTITLSPDHPTRAQIVISHGGIEISAFLASTVVPLFLRRPIAFGDVIHPHGLAQVRFRGFASGELKVGHALRGGVVPDVVEAKVPCRNLSLDASVHPPASHTRVGLARLHETAAIPLARQPGGPPRVEISLARDEWETDLVEVLERRRDDFRIAWRRSRETLVGWVPAYLLSPAESAEELEEWTAPEPAVAEPRGPVEVDPAATTCTADVALYALGSKDMVGYEKPVKIGRIKANTPFSVQAPAEPETLSPEPMHYVYSDSLEQAFIADHGMAVPTARLKGCKGPPLPLP